MNPKSACLGRNLFVSQYNIYYCTRMDDYLCDTTITGTKLEHILENSKKINLNGHRLVKVDAAKIGDDGFTSFILRVNLAWSSIKESVVETKLPESIILKITSGDAKRKKYINKEKAEMDKNVQDLLSLHDNECVIYELDELPKIAPMPLCYAKMSSREYEPAFMVMEDLGAKGASIPLKMLGQGLTKAQLESALDTLTSLHAWSMNTSVPWREKVPSIGEIAQLQSFFQLLLSKVQAAKHAYPTVFKDLDSETMEKYFTMGKLLEVFGPDPKNRYNLPTVLVHGDFHLANMIFEKHHNNYGNRLVAMLDWQISHKGCGLEDLARLECMSLSTELRRMECSNILQNYVEVRKFYPFIRSVGICFFIFCINVSQFFFAYLPKHHIKSKNTFFI